LTDDERELIERAQEGDSEAFLALLARYDRQIMSVVYRFAGNLYDREDLYQEIFLHCFRSIKSFRFRSSFLTWLYRLALNRCRSHIKKRPPLAEPRDTPAPEMDWERREKLEAVRRAALKLRGPQHICFHLYYVEDWNTARIAELLECSEGTVKSHLNRARLKIRAEREVLVWRTNP
jgi:RNA polymerase sigma-70 factor (ECF subfamily)